MCYRTIVGHGLIVASSLRNHAFLPNILGIFISTPRTGFVLRFCLIMTMPSGPPFKFSSLHVYRILFDFARLSLTMPGPMIVQIINVVTIAIITWKNKCGNDCHHTLKTQSWTDKSHWIEYSPPLAEGIPRIFKCVAACCSMLQSRPVPGLSSAWFMDLSTLES